MYYQFTGQPGHGKTVLALAFALEMKAKADKLHAEDPSKHPHRELYVCNVRDFNAGKAGAIEITPQELISWCDHPAYLERRAALDAQAPHMSKEERERAERELEESRESTAMINPAFENAIVVVDEAYESSMFPKRPPGRAVPRHVARVAKHRHFGIDFVMVCQSPTRQMDDFLHDLIEEHYHIRRRFGLPLVHVKRWDRFERNPDKATPLTTTRRKYPTEIFKLYTSTKYDTSEKRVPWFYWACGALVVALLALVWYTSNRLDERFSERTAATADAARTGGNGAGATVPTGQGGKTPDSEPMTPTEYAKAHLPRFGAAPWTAPVYDGRPVTADPQLYCMSSMPSPSEPGEPSCRCLTEQGTRYELSQPECRTIARHGAPYNPYRQKREEPARDRDHGPEFHPSAPQFSEGRVIGGNPAAVVGAGTVL